MVHNYLWIRRMLLRFFALGHTQLMHRVWSHQSFDR